MGRQKSLMFSAAVIQSASKNVVKPTKEPLQPLLQNKRSAINTISTSTESNSYFKYLTVVSRGLLDTRCMLTHRGRKKFWDDLRKDFSYNTEATLRSEHSQCLLY